MRWFHYNKLPCCFRATVPKTTSSDVVLVQGFEFFDRGQGPFDRFFFAQ